MKKKILFVNGHLNVGGVEKSLIDILKNLDYEKYAVDLILFEDLGDYFCELPKEVNVKFINLNSTYGSTIECLKKSLRKKDYFTFFMKIILILSNKIDQDFLSVAKFLLDVNKKYDCAIAFRVGFCAEFVSYCVNAKEKYVWWHHGECKYTKKTKERINKTFKNFNKVVSVSDGCKTMIENYFDNLKDKIVVIPNMIDINQIQNKAKLFDPYSNDNSTYKIVSVGRLSSEKNMKNIVYISKELIKNNFTDFTWYIVGDGAEYDTIKQLILENNLEECIKMVGSQNNPYPYIYYSSLMVHPSYVESQCLTVLEAFTLSIPCIVSESIGPKEFVKNGINAVLTSHDPKDIANQIINLLNNEEMINVIKNKCLKTVEGKYSNKYIIKKIDQLLDGGK